MAPLDCATPWPTQGCVIPIPTHGDERELVLFSNVSDLGRGLNRLHALTATVRPVLLPRAGRYEHRSAHRLSSSLAMMALLDNGRAWRAPMPKWGCGLPFTPKSPQAEYDFRGVEADKKTRQRRRFRARVAAGRPVNCACPPELVRSSPNGRGVHPIRGRHQPLARCWLPRRTGHLCRPFRSDAEALRHELQAELPFAELVADEQALGVRRTTLRSLAGERSALSRCTSRPRSSNDKSGQRSRHPGRDHALLRLAREVRHPRAHEPCAGVCYEPAALSSSHRKSSTSAGLLRIPLRIRTTACPARSGGVCYGRGWTAVCGRSPVRPGSRRPVDDALDRPDAALRLVSRRPPRAPSAQRRAGLPTRWRADSSPTRLGVLGASSS